ncbi:MAG: AMP-binding protein [bacterium]|nr:AMP-binding protein [bacterium]
MSDRIGDRTLRDLLDERAARRPDHPFLVFEDAAGTVREYGYADFSAAVDAAAAGLSDLGVVPGSKVTLHLRNCPEFLFAWFGLATIGGVAVPSNVANTADELRYVLDYSDSEMLITEPLLLETARAAAGGIAAVRHVLRTDEPERWMPAGGEPPRPPLGSEDAVEILFTSGTTSRPKGVVLTHANCLWSGERVVAAMTLGDDARCLTSLPTFHVNAQSVTVLSALTAAGTCILLQEFSASRFWGQMRAHRATQTSLVAMQLRTLLAQPPADTDADHSLERVFYAINVTDDEKKRFEERFAVELINGYGLSEAMTLVTMAPVFGDKRWPSIGLPLYDREVRILGDGGTVLPAGEIGEIAVSGVPGRTLFKEYYKDPDATAAALVDGWLHTGDNGWLDEDGYVFFLDRKKDVIKRAGENISASEVERVLVEHPAIEEVAVIGVPDPIRDEAVKAFVVLAEGENTTAEDIAAFCTTRLAGFKVPTVYEFRESLPKTSVGKIEKKALRQ